MEKRKRLVRKSGIRALVLGEAAKMLTRPTYEPFDETAIIVFGCVWWRD